MKRLAIIPARSGSKRIPNKNIKLLFGKPIIQYILNTASNSNLFEKIHISTNSNNIKKIVNNIGYEIDFMRPDYLADDYTPLMPVINFVYEKYRELGHEFDEIWLLMACNPLIEKEDLISAAKIFKEIKNNNNPLLAIKEYQTPVNWAMKIEKDNNILRPIFPDELNKRSQDLEKIYHDAGAFEIYTPDILKNLKGNLSDFGYYSYILEKSKSIDIDDLNDWEYLEFLFQKRNKL